MDVETATAEREPAWDVALLFPAQGEWSEEEYLDLSGNRLVELSSGNLEVLTMPTTYHQRLVVFLFKALSACVVPQGLGELLFAPLRVRLWPGKIREPDLVFMLAANKDRIHEQYWDGADLVVEVVSPDDRRRDTELKRREYARAGIPEYWIVDPVEASVTVLTLAGTRYEVHGTFRTGEQAASALLPDCRVDIAALFTVTPAE
jgi:YD repeat-containing protein